MASSNVCWGIEMGAGAVKALKLIRDGDDLKVAEFAVIPHKKVLSTPDLDQTDATRVAMGELVSRFDLTGATISISVPGHSAFARFAKLPPVEPKKIPDIVKFEAVQQIPFPIEDVEWDYQTFASADSPDVEVGIFAITRDKIMERLAMWADVGVTPDFVTLGPLAAYNALAWDLNFDSKTPGTVILDVGTTSTDLIVCEPGRVWVRTFPIGGHNFTEALVGAFKLSYLKAETLKRQAEQSKHARHVFQAMRPVFSDLAQDVQRSIGYYQSSHRDANLTRLIGLGSTFNLPGLRKYLGQQLQMEVVRLESFHRISVEGPAGAEFGAATINMATAYGLALQGLGFDHGIMANLMPVAVVREAIWKKKVKWVGIAAGLSIAAGALSLVRPLLDKMNTSTSHQTKPEVIEATKIKLANLKKDWTEVEKSFQSDDVQQVLYKTANVANLLNGREVYAHIADDLGQMWRQAQDKAGTDPATGVRFNEFRSTYAPTAAPLSDSGQPTDDHNATPTPAPADGGPIQKIRCQLEITTLRPDGEKFVTDTFKQWLYEAADSTTRNAVPYVIDKRSIRYVRREEKILASSSQAPPPPSFGGSPGQAPSPEPRPGMRTPIPGQERDPLPDPPVASIGGQQSAPSGSFGGAGQEGFKADDVEKFAPFPDPPAQGKTGDPIFRFTIMWDVILRQPAPAEKKS